MGDSGAVRKIGRRTGLERRMAEAKKAGRERKTPSDDKRNFFATCLAMSSKQAALEDDTTASEILEEAAKNWPPRRAVEHTAKKRRT